MSRSFFYFRHPAPITFHPFRLFSAPLFSVRIIVIYAQTAILNPRINAAFQRFSRINSFLCHSFIHLRARSRHFIHGAKTSNFCTSCTKSHQIFLHIDILHKIDNFNCFFTFTRFFVYNFGVFEKQKEGKVRNRSVSFPYYLGIYSQSKYTVSPVWADL